MKTKLLLVIIVFTALCSVIMAQQRANENIQINWRDYSFSTSRPVPDLIPAIHMTAFPEDVGSGYYFVQFVAPITAEMKNVVAETGAELMNYVPNNTYLVRMSSSQRDAVAELEVVQWVGIYQPALRISKALSNKLTGIEIEPERPEKYELTPKTQLSPVEKPLQLIVTIFRGEDLTKIRSEIERTGAQILEISEEKNHTKISVSITQENALQLAPINGVKWIEELKIKKLHNDVSRGIMNVTPVWSVHGLQGDDQIVGISDSGLDSGVDDASMHDDIEGRINNIFSWPVQAGYGVANTGADDGAAGVNDGHGTHTTGSVLGNGTVSGGTYSGVAPHANLVFQALMQETQFPPLYSELDGYYLTGIPLDLNDLFQQAYDEGARIHTNSWGGGDPGDYDGQSEDVDEFVWDNPDMLIIYSAGNDGSNDDGNNVIDLGSVTSPGTAKNCLTVGASENNRPTIPQTWYRWDGPIIDVDLQADDPSGMAAFSSRGPANSNTATVADDIIKPDLVAPGTMVISTRSQATPNTIWFQDDVESGINGWTAGGTWAQVTTDVHSGTTSWHDSPGGNYANNTSISLTSPVQNISGGGPGSKLLQFWYKYDLGTGDEVRLNLFGDILDAGLTLAEGNQADWELFTIALGPYDLGGGNLVNWSDDVNFQISFELNSDNDGNTGDGFYVDDVRIVEGAYVTARLSDFGLETVGSVNDENYLVMSGTSMSAPLTAGAATIVRQYYTDILGLEYVSAALLRATLINGATDISPGQYGAGVNQEISERPDNVQGWGRVNLENSIFPAAPASLDHIDELAGLETGENHTYSYEVTDNSVPVIITMVYHDFPGVGLVNNLDMTVTPPAGTTLYPNGLTTTDVNNNVEQIEIAAPQIGTYTITINGQSVPEGPQPYAIAISGDGSITERDPVDVMLVLDLSGSMLSPACPACDTKLQVLKDAVELFVRLWSAVTVPDDRIGINYFKTNITPLTIGGDVLVPLIGNTSTIIPDVQSKTTTIFDLTAMGGGLQSAINTLTDATKPRNIILFTDGMQNVNPMVIKIDDSPPGEFHLEIDNEPGRTPSNISPTTPPTVLDDVLDIKINTIGVGTSPSYIDILADIADETSGLTKITTAPDNDLRRFYVEELIDVLRDYSPQLLGYRYGSLSGGSATETFAVSNGAKKLILKCSWKRGTKLSLTVSKDGVTVPAGNASVNGPYYQIFVFDFKEDTTFTSGGEWNMMIKGEEGASYEVAAIVDEPELNYLFTIGEQKQTVGDPLIMDVRLSYDGRPITDAKVRARILSPQIGLGTLISISETPDTVPDNFHAEDNSTPGQIKLQKLLSVNSFHQKLIPGETVLDLTNNGDGSYSITFNNT
ncbi:MAG: S8 family serine peptidase, partial [Bacteroidales bacterium]